MENMMDGKHLWWLKSDMPVRQFHYMSRCRSMKLKISMITLISASEGMSHGNLFLKYFGVNLYLPFYENY